MGVIGFSSYSSMIEETSKGFSKDSSGLFLVFFAHRKIKNL